MKVVKRADCVGRRYDCYEVRLWDGRIVYVDKALADLSGRAAEMVAAEQHDQAIDRTGG